jgi:hypothetical protein
MTTAAALSSPSRVAAVQVSAARPGAPSKESTMCDYCASTPAAERRHEYCTCTAPKPHRLDVVAEVVFRTPAGEFAVQIRREDVTGTNGAYQAARDAAQEMVAFELKSMLLSHREGRELPALRPFTR